MNDRAAKKSNIGQSTKRKTVDLAINDQKSIQQNAAANALMIIWRPINPDAAAKLSRDGIMGKGLNIKAKSSIFVPIGGDIPYDARLSKIWNDPDNNVIIHAQEKLDNQLKNDDATHQKISLKANEKSFDINEYNDQLLVTKITKTLPIEGQDEIIYYFCDGDKGPITRNEDGDPWFAIKNGGNQYLFYNIITKKFDLSWEKVNAQNNWQPRLVEILAYRQLDNALQPHICPITADYDELVSAAAKFYPFENNNEIATSFNREFYQCLTQNNLQSLDTTAELILRYEQAVREENRRIRNDRMQPFMGLVSGWQHAFKNILKLDTNAHTNHGPEVNNPFPEPFSEKGSYAVFYPDKHCETREMSEEEVCKFINQYRNEGFSLDVNPRWGWEVNQETGELYVPDKGNRFDWYKVDDGIATIGQKMATLDEDRKDLLQAYNLENTDMNTNLLLSDGVDNFSSLLPILLSANQNITMNDKLDNILKKLSFIKKETESDEKEQKAVSSLPMDCINSQYDKLLDTQNNLNKCILKFHDEIQIRDLKLKIEKLKTESDLIYYHGKIVPPDQPSRITFEANEKDFRKKVMALVRKKEHQERWGKITKLEHDLNEKFAAYYDKFRWSCLIEEEINRLSKNMSMQSIDLESKQIDISTPFNPKNK